MALTALQVEKETCPKGTRRKKLADTGKTKGLFLYVTAAGAKTWHLRYTFNGKTEYLPLGAYPETTLKIARKMAGKARDQLTQKINPMDAIRKKAKPVMRERTFKAIALKWWERQSPKWSGEHARKVKKQWIESKRQSKGLNGLYFSTEFLYVKIMG